MNLATSERFDVLIVGAGPAGLSAAVAAAQSGARVGVMDDNPSPGGQIWRGEAAHPASPAAAMIAAAGKHGVKLFTGARVFDQPQPGMLWADTPEGPREIRYSNLVLATGARERFLPFPGCTLPNVMGAGALQALVKSGLSLSKRRVVVAGTGPLLLAVAAYLKDSGAGIAAICEQATTLSLARFAATLLWQPAKMSQALTLRKQLAGVPLLTGAWPIAAEGKSAVEAVVISRSGRRERIACDYLACGFHVVPNTELASLLGCRMENGCVAIDDFQRTSIPNIFCAGEPAGIAGAESAIVQGKIAGLCAAGREDLASSQFGERRKLRRFSRAMERAFALRPELRQMADAQTIICRCEDVALARLQPHRSWRSAKLQTRCGMGPCQGRICGPAVEFLLGWAPDSVRPPIFPTTVSNLAYQPREQMQSDA